jgi:hypothetical protein
MAKRKVQKGPSWLEVGLGAFLSVILGVVAGAAYMITKPVIAVKTIPKDAPSGQIYYIEGSRGSMRSGGVEEKRKSFVAGESVDVDEGEINVLLGEQGKPSGPSGKAGDKGPPPEAKMVDVGPLNARIHNGMIQFAAPLNLNVFTVMGTLIVQADGNFVKRGGTFVYVPDTLYVGGCPVTRIPFASDFVMGKFLFAKPVPDDLAAAWSKLVSVQIEGNTLHLRTP